MLLFGRSWRADFEGPESVWSLLNGKIRRLTSFADGPGGAPPAIAISENLVCEERTSMKFRPLHDRVVVKRIEAEEKTAGGIIIPDTAKEKPQQGEVIAVGLGGRDETDKLIPVDVKAGDRVLFGKWSGTEVKIDGIEYLIMKESDIMGVLVGARR
jgi:chaperonin GroES